jgi:cobalt-zinc-cadmium efflux system membrane fusion protein
MTNNCFIKGLIIIGSLCLLASCGQKSHSDDASAHQLTYAGDTVIVPDGSAVFSKLRMEVAYFRDYLSDCTTTGTVRPLSGHLAEVSSPFEGRIVRSLAKLGQHVSAGTSLFEVSSSDYFDAVKAYMQAKQSKMLSEKNYQRKKDLTGHGIGSQKELEEAEADYHIAEKELDKTKATLKIFNVRTDGSDLSRPLVVRSPIAGEVVKNDLVVGQYLKGDAEAAVTVADLNKVWVVARVKENHIGEIDRKDQVTVATESDPQHPVKGFVDYIGNMMDEQTRSVEVYVECNNPNHLLKPGMFVTTSFEHRHGNAIVLPAGAVLQQEDKSYVFVKAGKNRFVKRPVIVVSDGNKNQLVKSGVSAGETVVVQGGIYLR